MKKILKSIQKKETPDKYQHLQNALDLGRSDKSTRFKIFLITALAGGGFGLVAGVIYILIDHPPWSPLIILPALFFLTSTISGLAGLGAVILEDLLQKWGLKIPWLRKILSFITVAGIIFPLALIAANQLYPKNSEAFTHNYTIWGMLAGLLYGIAFAFIAFFIERYKLKDKLIKITNQHLTELASREELLQEATRNLLLAEERNRMARDIHDSVIQGMHGVVYSLRSLRPVLQGNPRGLEILNHLDETAACTVKDLRNLVEDMSPALLDNSLQESLLLHCDLFARRLQIMVDSNIDYRGGLQPEQEVAIYRITQEALANIQKHAHADKVSVTLSAENEQGVKLIIYDNGCGFDPNSLVEGCGLNNMKTRARQNNGYVEIETGNGTTVTALFFYQNPATEEVKPI